jgi:hypothetical protein
MNCGTPIKAWLRTTGLRPCQLYAVRVPYSASLSGWNWKPKQTDLDNEISTIRMSFLISNAIQFRAKESSVAHATYCCKYKRTFLHKRLQLSNTLFLLRFLGGLKMERTNNCVYWFAVSSSNPYFTNGHGVTFQKAWIVSTSLWG